MEGVVNIVDAMLVFACGLMLSLVIYWNVDLRSDDYIPVTPGDEIVNADRIQEAIEGNSNNNGEEYVRLGTVYQDPVTGELYMAED
jgi:hypothetical protein